MSSLFQPADLAEIVRRILALEFGAARRCSQVLNHCISPLSSRRNSG